MKKSINSLNSKNFILLSNKKYIYYDINKAAEALSIDITRLPFSIKILLENAIRNEDNIAVTKDDIISIASWEKSNQNKEISFYPARVLMQDFTGVPAIVDLAAMRDAMNSIGGDPKKINPLIPVDLVIDHSVQVDHSASSDSFRKNVDIEMNRNKERYEFLRWGQEVFDNFRVVPPGTGICHQVNLEYLAKVVFTQQINDDEYIYPDTVVGTDSHTTMVNALSVLGWGVGGIEAESVMLGQAVSMLIPEVIGFKITNQLKEGVTATDLVLTITEMLRKKNVVNKFVEFYGNGIRNLKLADRATIANMAPEYGATCGFFPIDEETIKYLRLTNRDNNQIDLIEKYAKIQNLWLDDNSIEPVFTDYLELDLSIVEPSISGPKRPQDRILLKSVKKSFAKSFPEAELGKKYEVKNKDYNISNGDIVIAAITSCTNTSNPNVMIAAGLLAKSAFDLGLKVKPWVKTSFAPGSKIVTEYLKESGLDYYLDKIGFNLVGYGCTTCIGNSGPIDSDIENTINDNDIITASVLSGNRNFEGRIHRSVRANYLMSPPLVVAYSFIGNIDIDISKDPIATKEGRDIYLKDIWPSNSKIQEYVNRYVNREMFAKKYKDVFLGDSLWQDIKITKTELYNWDKNSTYINNPPYFEKIKDKKTALSPIINAKLLAIFGDSITTDHISPAGDIAKDSPAARYLSKKSIKESDFNSYGARRGDHEVMMRGTFANIRIKNELLDNIEGGYSRYQDDKDILSIYDIAMKYKSTKKDLIIIAGKEYGTGSSRDWAAKGTHLLGVRAVIAESFERIHRSNLIGMGVLPLVFTDGNNRKNLKLSGNETFSLYDLDKIKPQTKIKCIIKRDDGAEESIDLLCRIDTMDELKYMQLGGILQSVIFSLFDNYN